MCVVEEVFVMIDSIESHLFGGSLRQDDRIFMINKMHHAHLENPVIMSKDLYSIATILFFKKT
jgi:hypothetical protein